MIQYYYKDGAPGLTKNSLIAIIDKQFYWEMEWTGDVSMQNASITDFNAGFLSDLIREKCVSLMEISPVEFRHRFNSFAIYIERAISGFKSYILWISPDPEVIDNEKWKMV